MCKKGLWRGLGECERGKDFLVREQVFKGRAREPFSFLNIQFCVFCSFLLNCRQDKDLKESTRYLLYAVPTNTQSKKKNITFLAPEVTCNILPETI